MMLVMRIQLLPVFIPFIDLLSDSYGNIENDCILKRLSSRVKSKYYRAVFDDSVDFRIIRRGKFDTFYTVIESPSDDFKE